MNPPVPEVTELIHKITKDRHAGEYQLHIKKFLGFIALGQAAAETQTVSAVHRLVSVSSLGCARRRKVVGPWWHRRQIPRAAKAIPLPMQSAIRLGGRGSQM